MNNKFPCLKIVESKHALFCGVRSFLLMIAISAQMGAAQAGIAKVDLTPEQTGQAWKNYWENDRDYKPDTQFPYQSCFESAAASHDVPLSLALAVSRGESNFNPKAVSTADAIGMMQILWPITAKDLGITEKAKLYEPCINIDAGVRYLRRMLDRYNNNVHLAIAAYNYGPGRIKPGDTTIPEGAAWYSGYIQNHLRYVLGTQSDGAVRKAPARYEDERRLTVIVFNDPGRANAYVSYMRETAPSVRLDWFDNRLGRWSVDMLYQDQSEKAASIKALDAAGFSVTE